MRYSIIYIKYPRNNRHCTKYKEITEHKIVEGNSQLEAAIDYLIEKFEKDFEIDYPFIINDEKYYKEELNSYKEELMKCKNFQELEEQLEIELDYISVIEIPELK
jgi:hypothetical protein